MEWMQYILVLICVALAVGYLLRFIARSMTQTGCAAKGCAMVRRTSETGLKRTPLVQVGAPAPTSSDDGLGDSTINQ